MRAWQTQLLALGLPLLVAAELGHQHESPNIRTSGTTARAAGTSTLSPEDLQLLRELPLLMEWELLRDWDPEEDLPIPLDSAPPRRKEAP